MGLTLIGASGDGSGVVTSTASETRYNGFGSCLLNFDTGMTTESKAQTRWKDAGTFKQMSCVVVTNTRGTATTFNFRKGGSSQSQAISVTANTTGQFSDLVDADLVATDNLVDFAQTTGSGAGNFLCNAITMTFDGGSSYGGIINSSDWRSVAVNSGFTSWDAASGALQDNSENPGLAARAKACTLSYFFAIVASSVNNAIQTWNTRVGLANGNCTLSIPANATAGLYIDTVDSDTVADNTLIDWQHTDAGAGNNRYFTVGAWAEIPLGGKQNVLVSQTPSTGLLAATTFYPILGTVPGSTTELNTQTPCTFLATWTNLRILTTTVPNQTITLSSRIGGANGHQSVSIPNGGGAGYYEDTTDSDTVAANSLINYAISGNSLGFQQFTSQLAQASGFIPPGQIKHPKPPRPKPPPPGPVPSPYPVTGIPATPASTILAVPVSFKKAPIPKRSVVATIAPQAPGGSGVPQNQTFLSPVGLGLGR